MAVSFFFFLLYKFVYGGKFMYVLAYFPVVTKWEIMYVHKFNAGKIHVWTNIYGCTYIYDSTICNTLCTGYNLWLYICVSTELYVWNA